MGAMAALGYDCYAVSLRGHGGSEGRIRGGSIDDYVADVASIAATLEREPVVIGHSMGGFTTQHYLARGLPAAAGILVSSVPGRGAWRAALKAARNHPVVFARINATLNVGPLVETPERAHEYLFAPSVPHSVVERYSARLQDASFRAFLDLLLKTPDLSEGGSPHSGHRWRRGRLLRHRRMTGHGNRAGADLVVIPGAGHEIMLEEAWTRLVDHFDGFVSGPTEV